MTNKQDSVAVLRELRDRFPEINPCNYDHDDACALNAWGVEACAAIAALATASPEAQRRFRGIGELERTGYLPAGTAAEREQTSPDARREACIAYPKVEGLHPDTEHLVAQFAYALACKLAAAEKKYGYSNGWLRADWMDECRARLMDHVTKGDPRDVAAYCAFLWHHGESTSPPSAVSAASTVGGDVVLVPREDLRNLLDENLEAAKIALGLHSSIDFIEEHGGPDSEDDTERMAYHLFYSLHAAERLRAILEGPAAGEGNGNGRR